MKVPSLPPSFKIFEKISEMNKAFTAAERFAAPITIEDFVTVPDYCYKFQQESLTMNPEEFIKAERLLSAINKLQWLSTDYFHELNHEIYSKVRHVSEFVRYDSLSSSARIQALKRELKRGKRRFKARYYAALQELRELLDHAEFDQIVKEISTSLQSLRNLASRLHGKIRIISKSISSVNGTADPNIILLKKNHVFLKMSVDEDLIK